MGEQTKDQYSFNNIFVVEMSGGVLFKGHPLFYLTVFLHFDNIIITLYLGCGKVYKNYGKP